MKSLQHTSFKTMLQYTPEEIKYFLDLAAKLKADKKAGKEIKTLVGKNFALIFEKTLRGHVVPLRSVLRIKVLIQHILALQVPK